jgi:hypothetical protein
MARAYVCRWCGARVTGEWHKQREEKARHQGGWCPKERKLAYRQRLERELEDLAAELGEVGSCTPGQRQRELLALRKKARLAGVRNVGPITARGWARSRAAARGAS